MRIPEEPRIKVFTRSMNPVLYRAAMGMLDASWPQERLVDTTALGYLLAVVADESADYAVNIDEDAFVMDPSRLTALVDHVVANSFINAGMPDGGVLPMRGGNPVVTNPCFTIMHTRAIREVLDLKAIEEAPLDSAAAMRDVPVPMLREPWRQGDEIEPYYRFFLWLAGQGKTLYLDATTHADGVTSVIKDHCGQPFLLHTWFSRDFGRSRRQTDRILAVIDEAALAGGVAKPVGVFERLRLRAICGAHGVKARIASR